MNGCKRSSRAVLRSILGTAALTILSGWARAEPDRFAICYGQDATTEQLAPYRRLVLDGDHHPPLAPLLARNVELFGYVSVGEADQERSHYPAAVASGALLGANANWPGARYVDLRRPAWSALLLDQIIPAVLGKGFNGLFLDTLDDAAFLEQADPIGNRGMVEAGAALVRAIHARYPALPLMLNRAYEVAALVAGDLDSVLAESLASTYDFKTRRYHLRPEADLNWGLARLAELRQLNPRLRLYT
ncbi:MAG: endo alpha-1,4 polygalactosaminidase, partial [Pseudomonadota bacterium]|nr:endo alpha-1,4 polygalactosaminidase [Pseudomonadota bacterium]